METLEVTIECRGEQTVAKCAALGIELSAPDYDAAREAMVVQINRRRGGKPKAAVRFVGDKPPASAFNREPIAGCPMAPEPRRSHSAFGEVPQWIIDFADKHKDAAFSPEQARRVSRKFKTPLSRDIIKGRGEDG